MTDEMKKFRSGEETAPLAVQGHMKDLCKNFWPGWETVRLIGRGSFGAVYEIQQNLPGWR